jgi:hypothetical protein
MVVVVVLVVVLVVAVTVVVRRRNTNAVKRTLAQYLPSVLALYNQSVTVSSFTPQQQQQNNRTATTLTCGVVSGTIEPPISNIPPTAVMPDMALVTDMSGECRAGVTPHTVW